MEKKIDVSNDFGFRLLNLLILQQRRAYLVGKKSNDFTTVGEVLGSDQFIKQFEEKYVKHNNE
jgi:hypothetical protein